MEREFLITVSTSKPMDTRKESTVTLRIEDGPSGEMLAEVLFTPAEWWALLTGLTTRKPGRITNHPERIGTRMRVKDWPVPREAVTSYVRDEARSQALAWADSEGIPGGWDTVEARPTNQGWRIIARRWVGSVPEVTE